MFTCGVTVSTGCTPIDLVPPCVHVFVPYGESARQFGVLAWYMLMAFERYNKKIKNLVGNSTHPLSSLKTALLRDAGQEVILTRTLTLILILVPPSILISVSLQTLERQRGDHKVWITTTQSHHE